MKKFAYECYKLILWFDSKNQVGQITIDTFNELESFSIYLKKLQFTFITLSFDTLEDRSQYLKVYGVR